MSSEEHFLTDGDKTDEQIVLEQERADEERETSFQFQKEARDVDALIPSARPADDVPIPAATATAEDTTAAAIEAEEAAAVEEVTAPVANSLKKSRASTSALDEEGGEQTRKKARKSTITNPTSTKAAAEQDANVRLDRLRQALLRFLDLIEHRATRSSFAKALPHIDQESVEALRLQFIGQLKEAIIEESENLIESNELEAKLASLHRLAHEADVRYQAGYQQGAEEIKDVWRKEMDLETAISAKAIPDQQIRVEQLKNELDEVRKQNAAIHRQLMERRRASDAIQSDARESLDALDSAIKGLEASPEMQKQLRQTMDDLLQDLGARV